MGTSSSRRSSGAARASRISLEAWNAKMMEHLDVDVPDDAKGKRLRTSTGREARSSLPRSTCSGRSPRCRSGRRRALTRADLDSQMEAGSSASCASGSGTSSIAGAGATRRRRCWSASSPGCWTPSACRPPGRPRSPRSTASGVQPPAVRGQTPGREAAWLRVRRAGVGQTLECGRLRIRRFASSAWRASFDDRVGLLRRDHHPVGGAAVAHRPLVVELVDQFLRQSDLDPAVAPGMDELPAVDPKGRLAVELTDAARRRAARRCAGSRRGSCQRIAAVDDQRLAADHLGVGRTEERDGVGDVHRLDHPPGRRARSWRSSARGWGSGRVPRSPRPRPTRR